MRSKFFVHLRRQWMGAVALFLVLTGGTACTAADTIFSSDIVDGEVKTADIGRQPGAQADAPTCATTRRRGAASPRST